jgi:hypothetical protein
MGKWKGQRRRPYNTCRREKAENVLELVLVCIERALRICRKLVLPRKVVLTNDTTCCSMDLHVTNAFQEILVVHLEGTS